VEYLGIVLLMVLHLLLHFMTNGFSSFVYIGVNKEDAKEAHPLGDPNMEKGRSKFIMETL